MVAMRGKYKDFLLGLGGHGRNFPPHRILLEASFAFSIKFSFPPHRINLQFPLKWAFFYRDRNRVLSDPRYRPTTPVLVDRKVRGTTLQKRPK